MSPQDWALLDTQRSQYYREQQAKQALRMLSDTASDPSFGYTVNNFQHCLQSATMALRDGLPEEDIVVCLLHDVGFIGCCAGMRSFRMYTPTTTRPSTGTHASVGADTPISNGPRSSSSAMTRTPSTAPTIARR